MKILVQRTEKAEDYTLGHLYIDGVYQCDTLEDKDRGLTDSMTLTDIQAIKVKGETAIPIGTYLVEITYSNKFKKDLPLLKNVKGYDGVRIHSGNTKEDTLGCILVGTIDVKQKGFIKNSRDAFNKLFAKIKDEKEIWLTIY